MRPQSDPIWLALSGSWSAIAVANMFIIDELQRLARLREDGAITTAEYEAAKTALLAEVPDAAQPLPRPRGPLAKVLGGAAGAVLLAGLAFVIFDASLSMAATLGVTALAGLVVALHRQVAREDEA